MNYCKIKLNLNSGGACRHGNRKWVTLRRWGDVHAGGESCARAGEGVTLETHLRFTCQRRAPPLFKLSLIVQ